MINFNRSGVVALVPAVVILLFGCSGAGVGNRSGTSGGSTSPTPASAQWAATLQGGTASVTFASVAMDSSGDLYAVGYSTGSGTYNFGNGIAVTGKASGSNSNVLIVKYNPSGVALWADSLSSGAGPAAFTGVSVDASGDVYAVGYESGTGTYGFGNNITEQGTGSNNPLIVKYDSTGKAQWAATLTAGSGTATFGGVTIDSAGDVYAAGSTTGTTTYGFATGVTATGTGSQNVLLVKYNSSGTALWAQTLSAGTGIAAYNAVVADGSGDVIAAGYTTIAGSYGFGASVSATNLNNNDDILLVAYSASGTAQWAQMLTSAAGRARFQSVAVGSSGNIYVAGETEGSGTCAFGNGVTAAGFAKALNGNILLVKYNSSGSAQWARSVTSNSSGSVLLGVAVDGAGDVYVTGYTAAGSYDFGGGVTATVTAPGSNPAQFMNALLEEYNSSGAPQWADTASTGGGSSQFTGVAVEGTGEPYVSGYDQGTGTYGFASGVDVAGTATGTNDNSLLVKY